MHYALSNPNVPLIVAFVIAYLFGSVSSAIVVCKLMRLPDPRSRGSKNPGATNVLRIGGIKAAFFTLCGDVLKGVIPVLAAKHYGFDSLGVSLVAFAAFFGHLYPIFFRFQGGKGVATAIGVTLALTWPLGMALVLTWAAVALVFRFSSLAALIMMICAPVYAWYFIDMNSALVIGLMSVLLIMRHSSNIDNLIKGTENQLGRKAKIVKPVKKKS